MQDCSHKKEFGVRTFLETFEHCARMRWCPEKSWPVCWGSQRQHMVAKCEASRWWRLLHTQPQLQCVDVWIIILSGHSLIFSSSELLEATICDDCLRCWATPASISAAKRQAMYNHEDNSPINTVLLRREPISWTCLVSRQAFHVPLRRSQHHCFNISCLACRRRPMQSNT